MNGITFRAPGFSGTVSGLDLAAGRRRAGATFEINLYRTGDTLAGTATIVTRDETVPWVIVLRRTR